MAKTFKEEILSTFTHGEEVLNNIAVMRKVNTDNLKNAASVSKTINKLHPAQLTLRVNEIIDTGKRAHILRLTGENGYLPPFIAGQYINVFTNIKGVVTSRPYSLSSSPKNKAYYEITVAEIKNGFVSDYLNKEIKVGDVLTANGPCGDFVYNPIFHADKSLFLAGGSGITPFVSMLREILQANLKRNVVLLYGTNTSDMALYDELLTEYAKTYPNFTYHLIVSGNEPEWQGEKGFIDADLIKRLVPDYAERTAYICGPQIMNDFCSKELVTLGMPIKKIRREMFGSRPDVQNEAGWPQNVDKDAIFQVKVNNQVISAKANESILQALERNKIRVNVCCRSGQCSLCRVKLVKGDVFLSKGSLLRKADEKFGYIHSCKAYPISDVEILL